MKLLLLAAAILLGSYQGLYAQTDNATVSPDTVAVASIPTIAEADSAYNADNFRLAAQLYLDIIKTQGASAKLYYNLGNTYYRLGETGNAIIYYERALRLDPSDRAPRDNLAFVNARITDRPGERGTFIGNALDSVATATGSNTWAWVAFTCIVLTLGGLLAYVLSSSVPVRKTGFFGGILAMLVGAGCLFFAFRSAAISMADNIAIIVSPSTILSTVPRLPQDRNQEAMLLHEGTRVTILDSVRSTTDSINSLWYDVEIDNAHRAWINANAIKKI